jgi:hypothetical protein
MRSLIRIAGILAVVAHASNSATVANSPQPAFRFEKYSGFLGFGSDEAAAERDFLLAFPAWTPIEKIEGFFREIGGRCLQSRDWPKQVRCGYAHKMLWFVPVWIFPLLSTWSVVIWLDEERQRLFLIRMTAGTEGP